MRIIITLFAALCIAGIAQAQSPADVATQSMVDTSGGGWMSFDNTNGHYTVRLPGAPTEAREGELAISAYQLTDDVAFLVTYTDHDSDALARAAAKTLEAELLSDFDPDSMLRANVRNGRFAGTRVHVDRPDGSALDVLTIPAEKRVYQLIVVHRGTAQDPHVNMFFSSFRVQTDAAASASAE